MSEKTVVVTGVNGFVGEHVAREFKSRGFSVVGVGYDEDANEKVLPLLDRYISCDLLDEQSVIAKFSLKSVRAVIHLAGLAAIGQSFEQPQRFMTENGIMTHNVLAQATRDNMNGRVVAVSSGALYDPNQPLPLTEDSKTNPNTPYAVGKLMAEEVVRYHRMRGLDAVIARPFNHIGPGQGPGFLLPDLLEQLQAAKETGTLLVGNIKTKRDYTDVRDIARAYAELALAPSLEHDTYNICSGESLSGETIISRLQEVTGIKDVKIEVDPARIRPNDIDDIYGDASRLQNETSWTPEIAIEQTIKDFVASNI
jgi:GDP-4-dehydro-6-deoxy-D-mannose reductase